MTTLILTALILLLICTATGLIFLVVTMSDQDDEEIFFKSKKKKNDPEEADYEIRIPKAVKKTEPQKYNLPKKSDIIPFSKSSKIVSHELKRDFEKVLAIMGSAANSITPESSESERETEFIDVLDIVNGKSLSGVPTNETDDYSQDIEEFLLGEQILKNDDSLW